MRALAAAALTLVALPAAASAGEWVAGDLHVHTTYSHDSYGGPGDDEPGPDEFYTAGHTVTSDFALAASRGLDYLAISDHNTVRAQSDPGFGTQGVIGIPSYENSLDGHAQMHGATKVYDKDFDGDRATSPAEAAQMVANLRADGGLFQANHPCEPSFAYDEIEVDTFEIWNLPWVYQHPFPSSGDNDCALRRWYSRLDKGETPTAVGGSDSHWLSTTSLQGAGQPTTWVYAENKSVEGILAGLRDGHTFISHQPPAYGGPKVWFEVDTPDEDEEPDAMQGDTVPHGSNVWMRVQGAAGAYVRYVTDGGEASLPTVVPSHDALIPVPLEGDETWVHAQVYGEDGKQWRDDLENVCNSVFTADMTGTTTYCVNRILMLAQTSALYLRDTSAP